MPKLMRDTPEKPAPEHWSLVGNHGKSETYLENISGNLMERVWGFHSETESDKRMASAMNSCVERCDKHVGENMRICVNECMDDLRKRKII